MIIILRDKDLRYNRNSTREKASWPSLCDTRVPRVFVHLRYYLYCIGRPGITGIASNYRESGMYWERIGIAWEACLYRKSIRGSGCRLRTALHPHGLRLTGDGTARGRKQKRQRGFDLFRRDASIDARVTLIMLQQPEPPTLRSK